MIPNLHQTAISSNWLSAASTLSLGGSIETFKEYFCLNHRNFTESFDLTTSKYIIKHSSGWKLETTISDEDLMNKIFIEVHGHPAGSGFIWYLIEQIKIYSQFHRCLK